MAKNIKIRELGGRAPKSNSVIFSGDWQDNKQNCQKINSISPRL
jgi:hypothetical protein